MRRRPTVLILRRALWLLVLELVVARPKDGLGELAEHSLLKSLASGYMVAERQQEPVGVSDMVSTTDAKIWLAGVP